MKYIVVEKEGMEVAITFPELVQHKEAFNVKGDAKSISAGFYEIRIDRGADTFDGSGVGGFWKLTDYPLVIRVWGGSNSLGLKCRGQADIEAIRFSLMVPTVVPEEMETTTSR